MQNWMWSRNIKVSKLFRSRKWALKTLWIFSHPTSHQLVCETEELQFLEWHYTPETHVTGEILHHWDARTDIYMLWSNHVTLDILNRWWVTISDLIRNNYVCTRQQGRCEKNWNRILSFYRFKLTIVGNLKARSRGSIPPHCLCLCRDVAWPDGI